MKNTLLIIGFLICAAASFALMEYSKNFMKDYGEWAMDKPHMKNISMNTQSMVDKCKLDRLQGRLKGHKESAECANPTLREAFIKEGFPHVDKLDVFLAHRVELAKMADDNQISEDTLAQRISDELFTLLGTVAVEPSKK